MSWLALRQFRTQALAALGALVVLGVALVVTGPHLVHLYDATVAPCGAHHDCSSVDANFSDQARGLHNLADDLMLVAPALVGLFWGAPLVARELETRTYQLAWTQSTTRARWIATKLALGGLMGVVAVGLLSLMVTWWSSPVDRLADMPYGTFDQRDVVPLAYAAFAFALGVASGVVIRRTLPAMAATLVGFFGVRYVVGQWVRPRLVTLSTYTTPFQGLNALLRGGVRIGPPGTGDFPVSDVVMNPAGQVLGHSEGIGANGTVGFSYGANGKVVFDGVGTCPNRFPPRVGHGSIESQLPRPSVAHAMQACVNSFHLRDVVGYIAPSRYWALQWYEGAIFFVLALALAWFSWWWVGRRLG